ncbi:MAG TPA: hypothetical protein IAA06_03345 [Candidatus Blautia faecavium]|uniref:Uncharacterized protein n=1 Tax=Candidatus Blautia faecavium TaxID=2838487 RepID=A0A9D2LR48_9FIRM|nr:hypothetical protein [Candidatus Blautia faecavium]
MKRESRCASLWLYKAFQKINGYSIILKNIGNSRQKEAKCQEELLQKEIDGLIIRDSCRKR